MSTNISVSVRLRPSNQTLFDSIVTVSGTTVCLSKARVRDSSVGGSKERYEVFGFDRCYADEHNSQEDIFRDIGAQAVRAVEDGFNSCVFAYGQTASGKTYTMFGSEYNEGLTPRILNALLKKAPSSPTHLGGERHCKIEMGYLEIYNEKVRDLLGWRPSSASVSYQLPSLKIREHPIEGVFVQGLTMHTLNSVAEVKEYLEQGNKIRAIAATNINEHSSRSHAIIVLKVTKRQSYLPGADGFSEVTSKLHLIDLAGSERVKHTGATNKRFKEGISINQSLTNLGKTISLLVEYSKLHPQKQNAFHIPYRNSSLTFLLKDSLGGNSKTFMIATISTAASNYSETRNTLLYASRARKIVNKPVVNQDMNLKVISDLRKEVECLKRLLNQASLNNNKSSAKPCAVSIGTDTSNMSIPECCVHSKLIQEQLSKDEETIDQLLHASSSASTERSTSPETTSSDISTHEFGPPFLCRAVGVNSTPNDINALSVAGMFFLHEGETKIGSDPAKVDILLTDEGISDLHCSLFIEDDSATIIKHESVTFLTVNGEPVMSHRFVNHGNEISLCEGTQSLTFYFPSQLATRLLRQHNKSSSRCSLASPPRSVSSCSSGPISRPLSHLYVDCSSNFSMTNLSQCSPDHSRCCVSMPVRCSFEHASNMSSVAATSPQPSLPPPPIYEDASQQTEFLCCEAGENLYQLQKALVESCNKGIKEILGENEIVRGQIECQMDMIRCDNRKMVLLEQKLYTEIEEELCNLNKTRKRLTRERIELEAILEKETAELERLSRAQKSRPASLRSMSDESLFSTTDYIPTPEIVPECQEEPPLTLVPPTPEDRHSLEDSFSQASVNRYCIMTDLQKTIDSRVKENLKEQQTKGALQKSVLNSHTKLADVERELSTISDKCNWLCSYCDKLKEYFEAERFSMRDFETKMGHFCADAKRQLDWKEDAMMRTKVKLENFKTQSCPVSPVHAALSWNSTYARQQEPVNRNSRLRRAVDEAFPRSERSVKSDRLQIPNNRSRLLKFANETSLYAFRAFTGHCDDSSILLSSRDCRSDSSFSAASMPMQSSMPSAAGMFKPLKSDLVSVSVPRFRRRKSNYNYFHEYQINVTLRDEAWTVFHRFSALRDVHLALKSKYPELRYLDFPPRKAFGSRLEKVAAERRLQLQQYLQCLVNLCVCRAAGQQCSHNDYEEELDDYGNNTVSGNEETSGHFRVEELTKECLIQLLPFLDPDLIASAKEGCQSHLADEDDGRLV